ncbi:YtxH domain-containing protein [Niallia oryzisoli]|uniref:YtxH domain-containing protein n=1 Tax=Niallia oryzisoli TaxID=1737571 RepID=A0ABZ2CE22_9BACI
MAGNERMNYELKKDKTDSRMSTKDFLIGTLIGAAVGSLTALLLAPKSGKELRGDLNNQAYLLREKTDHIRESVSIKGNELTSTVKDKTTAISKKVSEQSVDLVNKVKGLTTDAETKPVTNPVDELFEQTTHSESDIQKKLEETKRAFDETESKFNSK